MVRRILLARPAFRASNFVSRLATVRFRLVRFPLRVCITASPVRGVLRLVHGARNPYFQENRIFCDKPDFPLFLYG